MNNDKVKVFDYDKWFLNEMKYGNHTPDRIAKYAAIRNRKVLQCGLSQYTCTQDTSVVIPEKFVKLAHDTDKDGWSIERGMEFVDEYCGDVSDFIDSLNHEDSIFFFLHGYYELMRDENDYAVNLLKEYCLVDKEYWNEWMEKNGYEVEL